ncbi:MAG TPA: 1,4-dihydroxy-2-naphthoate polyprenyltransferase [Ignavibacteriaceae bacterium]|nr:1,4-dihydroxy-2-naphthoate polyprenyltransferase [Ignavibacteriaceae bacterium]
MKNYNKFEIWVLASRPKTLFAAFVPVIVGTSIANAEGEINLLASVVALVCSILIQIGTNFSNDLQDFIRGADSKERVGPLRVINEGLITTSQMKTAIFIVFFTAFMLGLYLIYLGGVVILIIGILSILAGLAYTSGPYPLAYHGLGDFAAFIFFGLIGTIGTYYLNTGEFSTISLIASIPVGALVTNILVVNNYRDLEQDKRAGKNTLAVKLGKTFSRYEFIILMTASFIVPLIIFLSYDVKGWVFLPYLTLPIAYKLILMMFKLTGPQLNKTLELTAKFSAIFGLLFSLGFLL